MPSENSLSDKGLRAAEMVKSGQDQAEAIERAPGIWESRGIGNSYLVTTSEGDVLVNAGTLRDARRGQQLFQVVSGHAIQFIILTQSHANQYGGLEIYKTPDNIVVAHRTYPEDRVYSAALDTHYRRGSRRIFGGITGNAADLIPTAEVAPDLLIGDDGYRFELGERAFEIIHTPGGETRSAVVLWLPKERIAIVGNLFGPLFGNHPNLNTMRGDKPRWALQFVESAKRVRDLKPIQILTGHEDIRGEDHIQKELTRIIDSVQWVHDETVKGMNEGKDIRTLMREIRTPEHLTLTEEYGKLSWNVRAIWHEYSGWFDAARGTTDLYGIGPSSVADTLASLAGGADAISRAAAAFVAEGKPLEALHLLDISLAAEPGSIVGRSVKKEALELLNAQTGGKNLWERMWIASELRELDE